MKTADLVITSYALIPKYDHLHHMDWAYVILDEVQSIKNLATKQARADKMLKSRNRNVLMGNLSNPKTALTGRSFERKVRTGAAPVETLPKQKEYDSCGLKDETSNAPAGDDPARQPIDKTLVSL